MQPAYWHNSTNMEKPIQLTAYSRGAGCGCKIAPAVLQEMIKTALPSDSFASLLVGNQSNDDAAVYDIGNGRAIISTADFFMPIVDDPTDFGKVAAANAISDVYAMGGSPLMAIALLGWPIEKLPASVAADVLDGARIICKEVGIPLAGGHTIDSTEPIFGLAVTGLVEQAHLKKNNEAKPGDWLFLTKPLGLGVLSTAQKRGLILPEHAEKMIQTMTTVNTLGESLGRIADVSALTDITGFGLLGHCIEMAEGSNTSINLFYNAIPVLEGVRNYISQRIVPDATYRNWNSYSNQTQFEKGVNVMEAFNLLPDPQTNGGLLIAVSEKSADQVVQLLTERGLIHHTNPIGRVTAAGDNRVIVSL